MHWSKLRNRSLKFPSEENITAFKQYRNFCVSLLRKEKKKFYSNLDISVMFDNKKFWKYVKPLFSGKSNLKSGITLIEEDNVVTDEQKVAELLNDYFIDAVQNLEIDTFYRKEIVEDPEESQNDKISRILKQYESHPSIVMIKNKIKITKKFKFEDINEDDMFKRIASLDPKKATNANDIPKDVLLGTNDIVCHYITDMYNEDKNKCHFPKILKTADVNPQFKDDDRTAKKNYRPVSNLLVLSKVYEGIMTDQMTEYMHEFLSPYLFAYIKERGPQYCLLMMTEMWKKALDEKKVGGAILTDLSKAFDCLSHELLIAKLEAYGFEQSALLFIYDYLKNRTQRTKVNKSYSSWRELLTGVPQGSILGPILFNIFINDIFLFLDKAKLGNYADDNTTYSVEKDVMELLKTLESDTYTVLNWFNFNEMKANQGKCHLIIADINHKNYDSKTFVYLEDAFLESENIVKLLGILIDKELTFEDHIRSLLKKANQKFHALMRASKYMSQDKLRILLKAFIESQFNYCPLIWMCHSKKMHNRINKLHERALRVVYKDKNLTFEELLQKDQAFTIHERNLQKLAVEMYKVKNGLCPEVMKDLFVLKSYGEEDFILPKVSTVNRGIETIRYRGPKTWAIVPQDIKMAPSLDVFKDKIKKWKPVDCDCRLCKTYIQGLGYGKLKDGIFA